MALGIKFCFENELAAPRSSRVHRSLLILGGCTKQDRTEASIVWG
jgi:hypothetical protein